MGAYPVYKRRRYLIKKSLQFKYIALVLFFALFVGVLTGYTIFQTSFTFLGEKLARVYPQGELVSIFKTTNIMVLVNLVLITPVIIIFALIFSHRIAGPLYNFEKVLREIGNGNFGIKMHLRKRDELKDIAEVVNTVIERLRAMTLENKEDVKSVIEQFEGLSEYVKKTGDGNIDINLIKEKLSSVNEVLSKLDNNFSKYTLG